jgi:hypothetical protein
MCTVVQILILRFWLMKVDNNAAGGLVIIVTRLEPSDCGFTKFMGNKKAPHPRGFHIS